MLEKEDMDLDPECQHQVEKKYLLEEDKKVEKFCLPNKSIKLKKRHEFLSLRNNCQTVHGKLVLINLKKDEVSQFKFGITVSKKIGNAVKRNYVKRILRSIILKNKHKINKSIIFEIIPKKGMVSSSFADIEEDIITILTNKNS